jgi:hypothetical protein
LKWRGIAQNIAQFMCIIAYYCAIGAQNDLRNNAQLRNTHHAGKLRIIAHRDFS